MSPDFERVAFGLFLAVALPRTLSGANGLVRFMLGAGIAIYASAVLGNYWVVYFAVAATALLASLPHRFSIELPRLRGNRRKVLMLATYFMRIFQANSYGLAIVLLTAAVIAVAVAVADPPQVVLSKLALLGANETAISLFGALNAIFVSNVAVRLAVNPSLQALERAGEDIAKLLPTSQLVGQLERFVVFTLVAGGQSDAAAIAIAIKSIVRVPEARRHEVGFVEYFLIGTLASVGVSLMNAIAVRLLLGQAPL